VSVVCWGFNLSEETSVTRGNDTTGYIMNWNTIRDKFYRFKVKQVLLDKRRTNQAVYEITAGFLTERVLNGDVQFREELSKMQRLQEEDKKFIKFLTNLKI
jgi:hypothetical protein